MVVLSAYYNREDAVEPTVYSILNQTFSDLQFLIWDDSSTDRTWKVMQDTAHKANDSRLRIHKHEANIGLTAGLNWAIQHTDSEYIAIIGSGDSCDATRLQKQVEALERDPLAAFCATKSVTYDPVQDLYFDDEEASVSPVIRFDDLKHVCPFTHGSVMYRRSKLAASGGYTEALKWCADWDMFFRLTRNNHAVYIDEPLYTRVARSDGVSFDPLRALEQIQYKHLAQSLNTDSSHRRAEVLNTLFEKGLETSLKHRKPGIRRDVFNRNVKICLMRRTKEGRQLKKMVMESAYPYTFFQRLLLTFADLSGRTKIDGFKLISFARKISRMGN